MLVSIDEILTKVILKIGGEIIKQTYKYANLGQAITSNGNCDDEILKISEIARDAFNYVLETVTERHISMNTINIIYTTIGEACVCVCAKFDQFLPVRPHFDTKRPVNFFHIATFPSPTFGPLFAFHCPLFFTKNNNLHAAMF